MSVPRFWCLVPAAGSGSRLDMTTPKQYMDLLGKPLICHTLDTLMSSKYISGVTVGLASGDERWQQCVSDEYAILGTYTGGDSRADTVLRGLYFLETHVGDEDWVLIHDAARPCIKTSDIERLVLARGARSSGALLAIKTTDTIKKQDEHRSSVQTIPRDKLWHAQTPQIFPYRTLRNALETCDRACVSDESSAMEIAGYRPQLVNGAVENLKVTTFEDLELAKTILQARYGILPS